MGNVRSENNQDNRYYKRLQGLAKNLQSKRLILNSILEKLLDGLVPCSKIEVLAVANEQNFWSHKSVEKKVQARLSGSSIVDFKDALKLTVDVIDETQSALDTQNNASGFRHSLQVLSPPNFKHIEERLSAIDSHLSNLKSITDYYNIRPKPEREPLRHAGIFWKARDVSERLYYALQTSFHCAYTHTVGLDLQHYTNFDDITCIDFSYRLAISHETMTHSQETKHETGALLSWQRVVVEKTWRTSPYPDTLLPHLAPGIVSSDDFAGFGVGLNLCEKLSQSENKLFDSYGILDNQVGRPTKRYSIKPDTSDNDSQPRSLVSLSDILAHNRFPVIPLTGRLQLALTISCSILQLHDTPWFPTILTSSHIFFLQEHNGPDPAAMYSRPLLLQHLANSAAPPTVHVQYPPEEEEQVVKLEGGLIANRNPTLLSLACLLIEVLLWQPLDSRCTTAGSPAGGAVDLMADFVAAQALMPNVKLMGEECEEAVECCLYEGRGSQRGRGLEDGELYEKVYRGVVPLLEKDLEWRRKK